VLEVRGSQAAFGYVSNAGLLLLEDSHATFPTAEGLFDIGGLGELRLVDSTTEGLVMPGPGSTVLAGGEVIFNGPLRTSADIGRLLAGETPVVRFNDGLRIGALLSQITQISVDADVAFGQDNVLSIEVGGAAPGMYDMLTVGGTIRLGGVLEFTFLSGYVPSVGDEFEFLNAFSITQSFRRFSLPRLPRGMGFDRKSVNSGILRVVAIPEPGAATLAAIMALGIVWRRRGGAWLNPTS
jgi:hypothetical protein